MAKDKRSMRILLHEFAKETTAHGIGKIDSADSVIWRILWALGVMAGTGMVIYQGILLLETYLSKPVKSDIDVTYSRVSHPLLQCELLQYHKWAFKNNKQVAHFICRELHEITKAKQALLFELCSLNLHVFGPDAITDGCYEQSQWFARFELALQVIPS